MALTDPRGPWCLGLLLHWDDPEEWYGEGGSGWGPCVHPWRMYPTLKVRKGSGEEIPLVQGKVQRLRFALPVSLQRDLSLLLLLTLDEGYLLTAALPYLQCGIAPLGPPAPVQPPLLGRGHSMVGVAARLILANEM